MDALFGANWQQVLVALGGVALVIVFFITVPPPLFIWGERRIAGWVQSRIGPNRVGPFGLLQTLADGVKLVVKEDIIPAAADRPLFRFAPYLAVAGATAAFVILPFGPNWIGSDLELGLLWYIAAGSFVTLAIVMSGWASNNKWSMLGAARSAAQVISYEIPVGLALLPAILLFGTLAPQAFVESQGFWPWQWNMFHNPGLFFCFFLYFVAALAEINRTPFDLPEAESELVSGYNTEYSSLRWALFMLAEYGDVYLISAISVCVFAGGWMHPWALEWRAETGGLLTAMESGKMGLYMANNYLGMLLVVGKSLVLVLVIILLRWTLPRLRVDQLMGVCWKYLIPLALAGLCITAAWMVAFPPQVPQYVSLLGLDIPVNYQAPAADLGPEALREAQTTGETASHWLVGGHWAWFPFGMTLFLLPWVIAIRQNNRAELGVASVAEAG